MGALHSARNVASVRKLMFAFVLDLVSEPLSGNCSDHVRATLGFAYIVDLVVEPPSGTYSKCKPEFIRQFAFVAAAQLLFNRVRVSFRLGLQDGTMLTIARLTDDLLSDSRLTDTSHGISPHWLAPH